MSFVSLCFLMSVSWKLRPNNVAGSISVTAGIGSKGAFQNKMVRMGFYLLIYWHFVESQSNLPAHYSAGLTQL